MSTSTRPDEADETTIGNQDQHYPIVWFDDSSTVTYWINRQLDDTMAIKASDEEFVFKRQLDSFSFTFTPKARSGK